MAKGVFYTVTGNIRKLNKRLRPEGVRVRAGLVDKILGPQFDEYQSLIGYSFSYDPADARKIIEASYWLDGYVADPNFNGTLCKMRKTMLKEYETAYLGWIGQLRKTREDGGRGKKTGQMNAKDLDHLVKVASRKYNADIWKKRSLFGPVKMDYGNGMIEYIAEFNYRPMHAERIVVAATEEHLKVWGGNLVETRAQLLGKYGEAFLQRVLGYHLR